MARLNAILVGVILLASVGKVLLVLDKKSLDEAQKEYLPVAVTEHLKAANLTGNMFNSYNWGGYFIYWLPDKPVFVDGRTDLYGDAFLSKDYLETASGASGWEATLDKYKVDYVVMEADSGLARSLRTAAGWKLDYEDKQAVVFVRQAVSNG